MNIIGRRGCGERSRFRRHAVDRKFQWRRVWVLRLDTRRRWTASFQPVYGHLTSVLGEWFEVSEGFKMRCDLIVNSQCECERLLLYRAILILTQLSNYSTSLPNATHCQMRHLSPVLSPHPFFEYCTYRFLVRCHVYSELARTYHPEWVGSSLLAQRQA